MRHGPTGPTAQYERAPGDALRPLPATYQRREPEKTALHALVRGHLETLLVHIPEHRGHRFRRIVDSKTEHRGQQNGPSWTALVI